MEIVENGEKAILKTKGRLRVLKDGTALAWVILFNDESPINQVPQNEPPIGQKIGVVRPSSLTTFLLLHKEKMC